MGDKLTEEQVIRALKRLAKGWPDHLWLWSASGDLWLMRCGPDGSPVYNSTGGVSPDYKICSFAGIENDGGDW